MLGAKLRGAQMPASMDQTIPFVIMEVRLPRILTAALVGGGLAMSGATYQGILYLLEYPEESADIAVKYGVEAQVTREQALWRFEQQRGLVLGRDALGLMRMDPAEWNKVVATLYQYGQIEIPECGH